MAETDDLPDGLARAILDGDPIDWPSLESSGGHADPALLHQLKILGRIANLHRPDPTFEPARHWGHLRVLERLGAGAHGVVYRAWDARLDREVALKLLSAPPHDAASRDTSIIEEGRLLARVRHPNVLTIFGAEQHGDQIGLWMELIHGRTLEQLLEGGRSFKSSEVCHIGIELCRALTAVHEAGLLHRDIKAHNVMLADDGRIVLMDFGTGRELERSMEPVAGTPLYLAPEIFSGTPASVRSDIYSVGVVLYRLLIGEYPVIGRTLDELRSRHREQRSIVLPRPTAPRRLGRIIERALHPDPDARYGSAQAITDDLRSVVSGPWRKVLWPAGAAAVLLLSALWLVPGVRDRVAGAAGVTASTGAATRTGMPVIAVLPLTNLNAEHGSDYFTDGLTDEILRHLSVIDGLEVRSRGSSFSFKGKARNVQEVGRQLGATHVVEGSVLRDGQRLRINAQLVQVSGDVVLWSQRFEREIEDLFAVQDEISRSIVNRLRLSVGRGQRRYDIDVDLYDQYLKARSLLESRSTPEDSREAARLLEEVVRRDPAFAPAHAGLATAYAYMSNSPYSGTDHESARARVGPAALKAVQLDPLLAEAHAAMGWMYAREFEWAKAERAFERALELNRTSTPTTVNYVYSTLRALGKLQYAERLLRRALIHDPLSWAAQRELATVLIAAGRPAKALEILQRFRATDPLTIDLSADRDLARALTFTGRHEAAIAVLTHPRAGGAGNEQWTALPLVKLGRRGEAEQLAQRHEAYPFRLAFIHAALGDENRALEALETMFSTEPQRVAVAMMQPELVRLRRNARWIELRRKLKMPPPLPVDLQP